MTFPSADACRNSNQLATTAGHFGDIHWVCAKAIVTMTANVGTDSSASNETVPKPFPAATAPAGRIGITAPFARPTASGSTATTGNPRPRFPWRSAPETATRTTNAARA